MKTQHTAEMVAQIVTNPIDGRSEGRYQMPIREKFVVVPASRLDLLQTLDHFNYTSKQSDKMVNESQKLDK